MKHVLFVLMILAATYSGAWAQRGQVGLKIGANCSQLSGKTWEQGYQSNLLAGLYAGIGGGKFGIQLEGLLQQSTFHTGKTAQDFYNHYYNDLRDSIKSGSFRMSSLALPLIFQIRFSKYFWLEAGPQYTMVIDINDKEKLLKDVKEVFGNESFDAVAGLGLRISRKINLTGRYVFGFSDLNSLQDIREKWQQRNIQVHLGFQF